MTASPLGQELQWYNRRYYSLRLIADNWTVRFLFPVVA